MGGRRFVVAWQDDAEIFFEKYKKEKTLDCGGAGRLCGYLEGARD